MARTYPSDLQRRPRRKTRGAGEPPLECGATHKTRGAGEPPLECGATRKTRKKPKQLEMRFRTWGGKRKGAGRRARRPGAAPHGRRVPLATRFPVHVSLSVADNLPSLRQPDVLEAIEQCLREVRTLSEPSGGHVADFRVVHYSIQRHHLHLIVEAKGRPALSRGMQGLSIRVAKRINKTLGRTGKVFTDRYFERLLRTPKQVRHCLLYVLNNVRRHAFQCGQRCEEGWIDPCSSGLYFDGWRGVRPRPPPESPLVAAPHTWLLAKGWRRHGLLAVDAIPG